MPSFILLKKREDKVDLDKDMQGIVEYEIFDSKDMAPTFGFNMKHLNTLASRWNDIQTRSYALVGPENDIRYMNENFISIQNSVHTNDKITTAKYYIKPDFRSKSGYYVQYEVRKSRGDLNTITDPDIVIINLDVPEKLVLITGNTSSIAPNILLENSNRYLIGEPQMLDFNSILRAAIENLNL